MVEASGLQWQARVAWLLWGGLELFAFWKRWPLKGESKSHLTMESSPALLEFKPVSPIIFEDEDNDIRELQKENNELISKLIRSEQNRRDTNKELCDVRDKKNDVEVKTKQRDNQIHQLQMKLTELVSILKQTERERVNFYNDLLIARKQLHDTEEKLFEVREKKREAEAERHDALRRLSTFKDFEMKNIEDKMAEQKREFKKMLEGKDVQIEEVQEKLRTMKGQIIAFQGNLIQKDNDIRELQKENNELISKLIRSEQNQRDTNKELCDVRDKKNSTESKTKQKDNQIHQLQMKVKELVSTLKQTESERMNFYDDLLIAKKQLHDTEEKLFEVREQKRNTEGKNHDALLRSGEMVSDIFFDKNPGIVHLSDEYRPTKLAEMFIKLYDNERTAAFTVMEDNNIPDRHMIDFLLDVVMESYVFCKNEVDSSWNVVSKWFLDDGLPKMEQMRNALKNGRKVIVLKLLPEIEQKYTSYITSICRHEPLKKLLSIEDIRKYMALCLKLTLLMNANDPPLYLECSGWKPIKDREEKQEDLLQSAKLPVDANNIKPATSPSNDENEIHKKSIYEKNFEEHPESKREELENDKYKEYTFRDSYTVINVWPVMYLHKGGPMLGKGIAQRVKDSKAGQSDNPRAWWK